MNFLELCNERFSARKYTSEMVSDEQLNYILEAVRMAPSAVNRQPWKFVIVRSDEAKAKLRECYNREWFVTAPLYVLCMKNVKENWVRACDGKPHGDVDVAIATEHLCLAAAEQGLGTCWVCNFDVDKVAELFAEPDFETVVIVPIGHIAADCPHGAKTRKPLAEIIKEI